MKSVFIYDSRENFIELNFQLGSFVTNFCYVRNIVIVVMCFIKTITDSAHHSLMSLTRSEQINLCSYFDNSATWGTEGLPPHIGVYMYTCDDTCSSNLYVGVCQLAPKLYFNCHLSISHTDYFSFGCHTFKDSWNLPNEENSI